MSATSPTFSVVIPAYNEEQAIGPVLERVLSLRARLAADGLDGPEVIVVDDGSSDRTAEIAGAVPQVQLIRHGGNRGYGAALKSGMVAARGDLIAFLDADGTYPPEHFPALWAEALAGADVVVGSRMANGAGAMPFSRRVGNFAFAALVTLLGNGRVRDSASGMRVLRREALQRLAPLPDGLNFTPIMSLRAMHEGLSVVEVPIPYAERVGRSKLSVVRDGVRYLQSIVWTALGYNPVRVLGGLGLAGIAVALSVGAGLVVTRLGGVTTLGPWGVAAVFVALVAGVSGVSLFGLGATFNYLLALLRREPIRYGVFGKPLFARPLERHFGWLGTVMGGIGAAVAAGSLALGASGWAIDRLWLYLVGSALLILVGLQLIVSWVLMRTLQDVAQRDADSARVRRPPGGATPPLA
jgi:glycosyltransferase involved in cell wall biosynthesis